MTVTTTSVGLRQRSLSAFSPSSRLWKPITVTSSTAINQGYPSSFHKHTLHLITQNLDGLSPRPIARANLLLNTLLNWNPNSKSNTLHPDGPKLPGTGTVDILFLQEVTTGVRKFILDNPKVRDAFFVTDAEDESSFDGVPFANMTLLSRARFLGGFEAETPERSSNQASHAVKLTIGPTHRVDLPSKYGRRALSTDIHTPGQAPPSSSSPTNSKTYRLINVHLDSLWPTFPNRAKQLNILADLLRARLRPTDLAGDPETTLFQNSPPHGQVSGRFDNSENEEPTTTLVTWIDTGTSDSVGLVPQGGAGLIAGDFNAISPADHALLAQNGLIDAWEALHLDVDSTRSTDNTSPVKLAAPLAAANNEGAEPGATWGLDRSVSFGHNPGRLDKIALLSSTTCAIQAEDLHILRPGTIEIPRPGGTSKYIPCSDHCALSFQFTIH